MGRLGRGLIIAVISAAFAASSAFALSTDSETQPGLPPIPFIVDEPTMVLDQPCPPQESDLLRWAHEATSDMFAVSNQISLTKEQELIIQQLTTVFENSTPKFQYSSISELKDDKGLNVGRVGFNSKAGALQELVRQYLSAHRNAPTPAQIEIKKYLPCLTQIKNTGKFECLYPNVDFSKLDGKARADALKNLDFGKVWQEACKDQAMRDLQDRFVNDQYFTPAADIANEAHLRSALARAFVYDSVIQGGEGGVALLVKETQKKYAETHGGVGSPTKDSEEIEWLKIFSFKREHHIAHGKVATVSRVRALTQLLKAGNLDLHFPIEFEYHGFFSLNSAR